MSELTAAHSTIEKAREVTNCPQGVDLQDHLKQLVAENLALKNVDNWMSRSDVGYAAQEISYESGANSDEALRAGMLAIIEDISTPTTDSILRAAEARGVEKFGEHVKAYNYSAGWQSKHFAEQLREGKA